MAPLAHGEDWPLERDGVPRPLADGDHRDGLARRVHRQPIIPIAPVVEPHVGERRVPSGIREAGRLDPEGQGQLLGREWAGIGNLHVVIRAIQAEAAAEPAARPDGFVHDGPRQAIARRIGDDRSAPLVELPVTGRSGDGWGRRQRGAAGFQIEHRGPAKGRGKGLLASGGSHRPRPCQAPRHGVEPFVGVGSARKLDGKGSVVWLIDEILLPHTGQTIAGRGQGIQRRHAGQVHARCIGAGVAQGRPSGGPP